ncbi:MAG: phosphatase PAP2 family protein [Proteobacteria bacterium]|nr:phosphatase PAP2 family protein [Pseudomonadota bacterium]
MNELYQYLFFYSAKFFLFFTHETIIVPLIVIGFIMGKREDFKSALYLILFTMIFNTVLKVTFEVPLAPHLQKLGYAFPSGHMQCAFVFYGWLALRTHSFFLKKTILILLIGCAWALVYLKYHTWWDVLGSIIFGIFTLSVYLFLFRKFGKFNPKLTGIFFFSTPSLFLGYLGYKGMIFPHVWMAYYALIGFFLAESIFETSYKLSWKKGLLGILGCLSFIFLIHSFFQKFLLEQVPFYIFEIQWLLCAVSLPFSVKILSLFEKHESF